MAASINYEKGRFARFFKAVEGRQVSRYGTARYSANLFVNAQTFGGHRKPMKHTDHRHKTISPLTARPCNPMELDCKVVTAITHDEAKRYRKEYNQHVQQNDLEEVDEKDYVAWLQHDADRVAELVKKNEGVAAAMDKAAARETELAGEAEAARKNREAKAAKAEAARIARNKTKKAKRVAKKDKPTGDASASAAGGDKGPGVPED